MTDYDHQDEGCVMKLVFPKNIIIGEEDKQYYLEKYRLLPKMNKNQIQISGLEMIVQNNEITVPSIFRTTVQKPVSLKKTIIILIDQDHRVIAKHEVDFSVLGVLPTNTACYLNLTFPKESIIVSDLSSVQSWSLAFEENLKQRLDLSELKEGAISEAARFQLEKIINDSELSDNELSFLGLSAKINSESDLEVTLLVQNGTKDLLEIKQLPLKFYDASGELAAQGTFKLKDFVIQPNTSKPMTIVFPKTGILKSDIDLQKWSLEHAH